MSNGLVTPLAGNCRSDNLLAAARNGVQKTKPQEKQDSSRFSADQQGHAKALQERWRIGQKVNSYTY